MRYLIPMFMITVISMTFPAGSYAFKYKNLDIQLRCGLDVRYDDNITYVPTDKKADSYTTISFGFGACYEGKNLSADILGNVNQDLFFTYGKFDNTNENAVFNMRWELSRYDTLTLKNAFIHDYEPRSFEAAFGRIGGRYGYYWNDFDLELTHELAKQLFIVGRYSNYLAYYDRADLSDSALNSIGIELQYAFDSANIFFGAYDYSVRKFSGDGSPSFNMPSIGFRRYFTKTLYAQVLGGAQLIKQFDGDHEIKPYYRISLTGDLDENTIATIYYVNETNTISYSKDTFTRWQISADVSRKITKKLAGFAAAFYGEGEYQTVDTTNNYSGARAGFTYDLGQDIHVSVKDTYSKNNSNNHNNEYTKNVIEIGIRARF